MDFLTAALYCESVDKDDSNLSGVLLTNFDPDDDLSRAKVIFYTVDELRSKLGSEITACGFRYTEDGVLLSDTNCRRVLDTELATYVGKAFTSEVKPALGLIDLVLLGATENFNVVVNADKNLAGEEKLISIPLANFKVSGSTLNIYAPYKNADGEFRTTSLVDIETDQAYPLTLTLDEGALDTLSQFTTAKPTIVELPGLESTGRVAVKLSPAFNPAPTLTGEAFCNYLAHNIAYYTLGLQVLDRFLVDDKYVPSPQEKDTAKRKVAKHNLNIQSTIKKAHVDVVMSLLTEPAKLDRLLEHDVEAKITKGWMDSIMSESANIVADTQEAQMMGACMSLKAMCKRKLLHFALELLAQRLYLVNLGTCDNSIGPTLKGGGISGISVKRTSW